MLSFDKLLQGRRGMTPVRLRMHNDDKSPSKSVSLRTG